MASWKEIAKRYDVRYFLIAFVDLFGTMRAKIVPVSAIETVAKAGAGFAGFATWFDMTPADPDVLVMADPDTVISLPWKPGVAWVTGDLFMRGKAGRAESAPSVKAGYGEGSERRLPNEDWCRM